MDSIGEIRRANLIILRARHRSLAALNEAIGRPRRDATLGQIINRSPDSKTGKRRSMGTPQARTIEKALRLPENWMDTRHADDPELSDQDRIRKSIAENHKADIASRNAGGTVDNGGMRLSRDEETVIAVLRQLPTGSAAWLAAFLEKVRDGRAAPDPDDIDLPAREAPSKPTKRTKDELHVDASPDGGSHRRRRDSPRSR